jgi:hypothetical protein
MEINAGHKSGGARELRTTEILRHTRIDGALENNDRTFVENPPDRTTRIYDRTHVRFVVLVDRSRNGDDEKVGPDHHAGIVGQEREAASQYVNVDRPRRVSALVQFSDSGFAAVIANDIKVLRQCDRQREADIAKPNH